MARTKVTREQFEILENKSFDTVIVKHTPTGARFTAYPGRQAFSSENLGRAGDVLDNGDEYHEEDIRAGALEVLREHEKP